MAPSIDLQHVSNLVSNLISNLAYSNLVSNLVSISQDTLPVDV